MVVGDDGVVARQGGRDLVPDRMRLRVAVQQQERRAVAAADGEQARGPAAQLHHVAPAEGWQPPQRDGEDHDQHERQPERRDRDAGEAGEVDDGVGLFGDPERTTQALTDIVGDLGPDTAADTFADHRATSFAETNSFISRRITLSSPPK